MRPSKRIPGDYSYVEPPDPISNSEVKRVYADGSVHLACESRSSPGSLPENPSRKAGVFLCENINPPALRAVHVQRAWIHANPGFPLCNISMGAVRAGFGTSLRSIEISQALNNRKRQQQKADTEAGF